MHSRSGVHRKHWIASSTTPHDNSAKKHFRVTHPFHPLFGQEFELVEYRNNWGEDRVYFFNTKGEVRSIPAGCTNAAGVDPFVEISAGRSFFRTKDLMELADLLERLR